MNLMSLYLQICTNETKWNHLVLMQVSNQDAVKNVLLDWSRVSCCVKATASVLSNNKSTALIWLSNNDWTFYRHLGDFFHGNNNLAKNSPKIFGIKNTHFSCEICLGNFRRFLIKIG